MATTIEIDFPYAWHMDADRLLTIAEVVVALELDHAAGYDGKRNESFLRIDYNDRHLLIIAHGKIQNPVFVS